MVELLTEEELQRWEKGVNDWHPSEAVSIASIAPLVAEVRRLRTERLNDLRDLKAYIEALEAENKLLKRTLARIREGAAFSYRKFESSGRKLTYDQIAEIAAEAIKWEQGQDLDLTRKADNG